MWDVGWQDDEVGFIPQFYGYQTREEAEAEIPGFYERLERKREAEEREENERFPNLGYVRAKIKELHGSDLTKFFDAQDKLDALLDMNLYERITWPLPSWKAIKSRRGY